MAFMLSGCSAHPLPEDVTGFDTVQIVAKVRCEVRDGIRAHILGALLDPSLTSNFPRAAELSDKLDDGTLDWRNLRRHLKEYRADASTWNVLERYNGSAIAYEFIFNITENNKTDTSLDLLRTVSRGAISGGIGGSSTLDRNNIRTFTVADNFEDLATLFGPRYCGPGSSNGTERSHRRAANVVYPVAGALGLQELVGAFLNLNQSGNLVGLSNAPAQAALLPTISETMKFTTTFTGGGSLGFAAATDTRRGLRLAKASLTSANTREDIHTLRIVLKLPLEGTERTRTIAEQRLAALGVPLPRSGKISDLVRASALADLSLAPEKEYLETKILVGQSGRGLLPE